MARQRPTRATLYDFRDLDIMLHLAENMNGGIPTDELAELLGFDEGKEANGAVGRRLGWMKHYGMVSQDKEHKGWSLTPSGDRVTKAHLRAPALAQVEKLPPEATVELMGLVVSRYQRGEPMLAAMLRREFAYGTEQRRRQGR